MVVIPGLLQIELWNEKEEERQIKLKHSTSGKSTPELIEMIRVLDDQLPFLTEEQKTIMFTWARGVGRTKATPLLVHHGFKVRDGGEMMVLGGANALVIKRFVMLRFGRNTLV